MTALTGPLLDLVTDGADIEHGGRSAVVLAVRRVMLSAHRRGVPYQVVYSLLTDTEHRRLAHQLAHGRGGRLISKAQRNRFIVQQWAKTAAVVAQRPAWSKDDALAHVQAVRDALDADRTVNEPQRSILRAVLDLAESYGTTRVAAPVHEVARRTGLTRTTVHRHLMRLCSDGHWLTLAIRGNHHTGRANLYRVGPGFEADHQRMGAPPPMSLPPPISRPTYIPPEESSPMPTATFTGTPQEIAATIHALIADPAVAAALADVTDEQTPRLRILPAGSGQR